MIKAIIIDLDGTTLPRNWHQISEENRVALEEAGQQGGGRLLAPGRYRAGVSTGGKLSWTV